MEYLWSKATGWQVASEWLYMGREPVARYEAGVARALVGDHLGSVRAEVWAHEGGWAVTCRSDYWPYGEAMTSTLSPSEGHRFTGHWREYRGSVTGGSVLEGLDFMHAREYDWRLGRFTAPDPAASSWNAYAYVSGNPVNFTDPQGLRPVNGEGWSDQPRNIAMAGSTETAWERLFSGMISATVDETISHNLSLVENYLRTLRDQDAAEEPFAVRQARALELARVLSAYEKRLAVLSHVYRRCEQWQAWVRAFLKSQSIKLHVFGDVESTTFAGTIAEVADRLSYRIGLAIPWTTMAHHVAEYIAADNGLYLLILDPWLASGFPGVYRPESWPYRVGTIVQLGP